MLQTFGTAALSDMVDDLVVYRSLVPCDTRLPGVEALRTELGLREPGLPRKTEPRYARVVAEMMRHGDRRRGGDGAFESLLLIGDTEHNDGTAFANLCDALHVPGAAFICDEGGDPPGLVAHRTGNHNLLLSNRWRLLEAFDRRLAAEGIEVGAATAVVVDIDKTALGARGRNHGAIDGARFEAVKRTASDMLGGEVDLPSAVAAYDHVNQTRFHPFTTDNQDYLAYLSLLVGSGWIGIDDLADGVLGGRWTDFSGLLDEVSAGADRLPEGVSAIHRQVTTAVAAGDPTPFKKFRAAEYLETVSRMTTDPEMEIDRILAESITITREVLEMAAEWRRRGALLFALSDKPDEASLPTPELAAQGYKPLHRTEALVVGESKDG
jgi:hypothetical protein